MNPKCIFIRTQFQFKLEFADVLDLLTVIARGYVRTEVTNKRHLYLIKQNQSLKRFNKSDQYSKRSI